MSFSTPRFFLQIFLLTGLAFHARANQTVIKSSDHFELIYAVTLPALNKPAQVWIPLAQSNAFQSVERKIETSLDGRILKDPQYGNSVFYLTPGPNDGEKTIAIHYKVKRTPKSRYSTTSEDPAKHAGPDRLVPTRPDYQQFAAELTKDSTDHLMKARKLYDHVAEKMRYDKSGQGWGRGDAVYACLAGAGNCTDFHSYFMALARPIGIPVRFAMGFTIPADKHEGTIKGYHCWAEFYAEKQWTPVDISEATKHPSLRNYYFGQQPGNRFEVSVGRDIELSPGPSSGPINLLFYPILEVDGKELKPDCTFTFKRTSNR
ncbi:MAG: transglutaminase-like domain-containing protein [Verrucomicrobiota bacterium]